MATKEKPNKSNSLEEVNQFFQNEFSGGSLTLELKRESPEQQAHRHKLERRESGLTIFKYISAVIFLAGVVIGCFLIIYSETASPENKALAINAIVLIIGIIGGLIAGKQLNSQKTEEK
jgi:hypothetical protein